MHEEKHTKRAKSLPQKPKKKPKSHSKDDDEEGEGSQAEEADGFEVVDEGDEEEEQVDFRSLLPSIRSAGRSYLVGQDEKDMRHVLKGRPAVRGRTREGEPRLGFRTLETEAAPTRRWVRADDEQVSPRSKTVKRNAGSRFAINSYYRNA